MEVSHSPQSERFVTLDGLRGIAALAVITDHVYSPTLNDLLASRYLAVDFFFVLSGFVIAHVYAERLASGLSFTKFMRARIIRLYPLYFVGLFLGASLMAGLWAKQWIDASGAHIAAATGFSLLMLPTPAALSPAPVNIYPFDGPAWSLFFELVANAAFALLILKLNTRLLIGIMVVAGAGVALIAAQTGNLAGGFNWETFWHGFPRVFYGFFAGVLVYRMHRAMRLPALPWWAAAGLLLALLMMPGEGAFRAVYEVTAVLLLFPLLVAFSANTAISGASATAAGWAGLVSYGVYILHVPIRDWLYAVFNVIQFDPPGETMLVLVTVLSVGGAAILHVVYDAPVRRWLSRSRRPATA